MRSSRAALSPDIVVSIATGYKNVNDYRQFISTLRRFHATCPVFLGIYDGPEYEPVKRYLLENAVNYFIVPPILPPNRVCYGYRFAQYAKWLREIEFRYALMLDFRDAYFQRDPFADIERFMHDCDLYLMSEFQLLTIRSHPNCLNYVWVEEPFGKEAADAIADKPILNSGAILGRKEAVIKCLDAIADVTAKQDYAFADQGTLNYLAHTGRLDHCGRVKLVRAGESLVNNCGFSEIDLLRATRTISVEEEAQIAFIPRDEHGRLKLCRDADGWVLDDGGSRSYVVHQHDRFPEVDQFAWRLSEYSYPDTVFVNGRNRAYRAEKYTLSSREALNAGAIERLIAIIKSRPVEKRPLLLINSQFKRGFAFAYGTLNIDLLFESEEFMSSFFDEARDEKKCNYFCEKWGYMPFFVDELEIFDPDAPRVDRTQTAQSFRDASMQAERWR